MRAKNLEWECFKKKNEDWKEMLAYQKANPTCITLDGADEKHEEKKKGSLKKSTKKRSSKSSNSKESSDEKKRKGGGGREKSEGVKVKKTPELPRSPRKEGSVLHPFFRKAP